MKLLQKFGTTFFETQCVGLYLDTLIHVHIRVTALMATYCCDALESDPLQF